MALMLTIRPRSRFFLPPFELAPLEFEPEAGDPQDELVPDGTVASIGPQDLGPERDAADELRRALRELRRSIG